MRLKMLFLFGLLTASTNIFANDYQYIGDFNGDKKKEKIIIQCSNKDNRIIELRIYDEQEKMIFAYNEFKPVPFIECKVVSFKGLISARDVLFIVVGGCDIFFHILSYDTIPRSDGGKNIKKFSIKQFVGQIESCY